MDFKELYYKLANLSFLKLYALTYLLTWGGILLFYGIGYILHNFINISQVISPITTLREDVIISVIPIKTSYLEIALVYIINNLLSCFLILFIYVVVSTLLKGRKDYYSTILVCYIIFCLNPLSGLLGGQLPPSVLMIIPIHGIFEIGGVSLFNTLGLKLSYYIKKKNLFSIPIKAVVVLTLIGCELIILAGFLEVFSWSVYAKLFVVH